MLTYDNTQAMATNNQNLILKIYLLFAIPGYLATKRSIKDKQLESLQNRFQIK